MENVAGSSASLLSLRLLRPTAPILIGARPSLSMPVVLVVSIPPTLISTITMPTTTATMVAPPTVVIVSSITTTATTPTAVIIPSAASTVATTTTATVVCIGTECFDVDTTLLGGIVTRPPALLLLLVAVSNIAGQIVEKRLLRVVHNLIAQPQLAQNRLSLVSGRRGSLGSRGCRGRILSGGVCFLGVSGGFGGGFRWVVFSKFHLLELLLNLFLVELLVHAGEVKLALKHQRMSGTTPATATTAPVGGTAHGPTVWRIPTTTSGMALEPLLLWVSPPVSSTPPPVRKTIPMALLVHPTIRPHVGGWEQTLRLSRRGLML
eukprot:comp19216_c0_seq1/m.21969 comp19216_c0_seq1/g.21969  ORF comp19216_c0_seq1/g.21969 comp19216_c0_seq1/m.21969 type:complete len:321 (+) comp19216_c0_seq1:513-1475(+)